eukprot:6201271-Pleurochrysis_carterae.AAC.2
MPSSKTNRTTVLFAACSFFASYCQWLLGLQGLDTNSASSLSPLPTADRTTAAAAPALDCASCLSAAANATSVAPSVNCAATTPCGEEEKLRACAEATDGSGAATKQTARSAHSLFVRLATRTRTGPCACA